jgi:hypothetical protein
MELAKEFNYLIWMRKRLGLGKKGLGSLHIGKAVIGRV